jgi:hypothetical protein
MVKILVASSCHPIPHRWHTVENYGERQKDVSLGQITPGINFSVKCIDSSQRQFLWPAISTDYTALYPRIECFLTIAVRTSFPITDIFCRCSEDGLLKG